MVSHLRVEPLTLDEDLVEERLAPRAVHRVAVPQVEQPLVPHVLPLARVALASASASASAASGSAASGSAATCAAGAREVASHHWDALRAVPEQREGGVSTYRDKQRHVTWEGGGSTCMQSQNSAIERTPSPFLSLSWKRCVSISTCVRARQREGRRMTGRMARKEDERKDERAPTAVALRGQGPEKKACLLQAVCLGRAATHAAHAPPPSPTVSRWRWRRAADDDFFFFLRRASPPAAAGASATPQAAG